MFKITSMPPSASPREPDMRVKFTADYDHRWPSGAFTAFKKGMDLTVKREAAEAAIAKGKATLVKDDDKPSGDGKAAKTADAGRSAGVAGADVHPSSRTAVRSERDDASGERE